MKIPGLGTFTFTPETKQRRNQEFEEELDQLSITVQKANAPLIAALRSNRSGNIENAGQDWAKTTYGNYYATSVHVYRAVKLRADAVASARLKVYSLDPQGNEQWVGENHPVQVFFDRFNPSWSRARGWRAIETYLSLWGSCFRWIDRSARNDITRWDTWVLRPDKTAIVVDTVPGRSNKYIKGFVYDPGGANFPMLPDEVIWDSYFNPLEEFAGLSPIAPTRLAAELQASMLSTNKDMFTDGIHPSNLAFLMKGPLTEHQVETFYERLEERHSRAHRPLVADLGQGNVTNLGFSNKEMEFLGGLQLTKEFVLTTYGVPEELMPGAEHATFANREEARIEFYQSTIEQEWVQLESQIQETVIPILPPEFRNLVIRFDRDEVPSLQENVDHKIDRSNKLLQSGSITLNEHREELGFDIIPGGDVLYLPNSVTPVPITDIETPPSGGNGNTPPPGQESFRTVRSLTNGHNGHQAIKIGVDDKGAWESFNRRFESSVRNMHQLMDDLFEDQRSETIRRLRSLVGTSDSPTQIRAKVDRAGGPDSVFNPGDWIGPFQDAGIPIISESIERSANAQVAEFGLGIDFTIANASTETWIRERSQFWASRVNEETASLIVDEIRTGISEGESLGKLQSRVDKVFDFSHDFRSERIARTEAVSSSNQGHQEAYRQADVPGKRWVTSIDGRQRESHQAANGQVVGREESFTVGGVSMIAPGQGPASEVVNCRCTMVPDFDFTTDDRDDAPVGAPEPPEPVEESAGTGALGGDRKTRTIKDIEYNQDGLPSRIIETQEQEEDV